MERHLLPFVLKFFSIVILIARDYLTDLTHNLDC